jgi:hypothetical protein
LLGFISTDGKSCEGVIQCSVQPILWEKVETKLLQKFTLGTDMNVSYLTRVCEEGLNEIDVEWISDRKREKRNNPQCKLHKDLVSVIFRKITANSIGVNEHVGKMVVGYTKAVMIASSNKRTIFYAHPCF